MKKNRILTLLFSFVVLSMSAQKFDVSAEIRPRFESQHGYKSLADSASLAANAISQRSRLNFNYANANVTMRVSLQNVRVWGDISTLAKADTSNSFHEAWAQVKISEMVSLKMGRQEIVYDDHRIFGNVGWAQQARSHDAFVFKLSPNERQRVDVGLALNSMSEKDTIYLANTAGYKAMEYLWYHGKFDKLGVSFLALNTAIDRLDSKGSKTADNMQTIGPRFTYKTDKFDANLATYMQTGKRNNLDVNALYFGSGVGYKLTDNFKLGAAIDYLSGKAMNDTVAEINSFMPLFGTNHKFNGWMDYFYVNNHGGSVGLMDINFLLAYKKDKFSAKLIPHLFSSAADMYDSNGKKTDGNLGTEIDFVLGYKITDDVVFNAGYSQMLATDNMEILKSGDKDENNSWGWVMFTFKPKLFSYTKK